MQGKSRVMAAVAAGALTVALGAGAARCAIAPQEGAQDSPQEQEQPAAAGADAATGKAASGAEALWNTAWTGAAHPPPPRPGGRGARGAGAGGPARARPCGRPVVRRPYPGQRARARSLPRRVWPRLREN